MTLRENIGCRKALTNQENISCRENIIHRLHGGWEKVLFPPLHIKLILMKYFNKALNVEGNYFKFVCIFLDLRSGKITPSVFAVSQIIKLTKCQVLSSSITDIEKLAWNSYVAVEEGYPKREKFINNKNLVNALIAFIFEAGTWE